MEGKYGKGNDPIQGRRQEYLNDAKRLEKKMVKISLMLKRSTQQIVLKTLKKKRKKIFKFYL